MSLCLCIERIITIHKHNDIRILLMYRNNPLDTETVQKEMTEINVAKHRNGPVGSFKLRFLKEFGRFVEIG